MENNSGKLKVFSRVLIVSGLLLLISYISLPNVKNFHYWKDDWVFIWANKYNPEAIYREFGTPGTGWQIKTGVFMLPYARLYGKVSPQTLQVSGIVLKFLNSVAVLLLAYTLTKNKLASILAALLYAGFSGGVEVYTWHRPTAVAIGFAVLAFSFHNLFLEHKRPVYFIGLCVFSLMALLSFFGRVVGIFPVFLISTLFNFYLRPSKFLIKYSLFLAVVILMLIILMRNTATKLAGTSYSQILVQSFKHIDVLFGNIGNLLRIPLFKLPEQGGLVGEISPLSLLIGKGFFVVLVAVTLIFLIKRSGLWQKLSMIFIWMAFTIIPNWLYAGGGATTMVGSSHRYQAGIAIGIPLIIALVLPRLPKLNQIIIFALLLIPFLSYSTYILNIESSLRNESLVKPIYQTIVTDTQADPWPRVLVIHTSLNHIIAGWFPYAYAYHKGLSDYAMFPTVFANLDAAAEWICAPDEQKDALAAKYAAPDYQFGRPVLKTNIHTWLIGLDGQVTNETKSFREKVSKCL